MIPLPAPAPGGWVITEDGATLIVSQPKTAELLYFDTVNEELTQRVELDFAPGTMLLNGDSMYVAVDGGAVIHKLDRKTAKPQARYTVRGNAITDLALDPGDNQRLFAATSTYEIFAVDLTTRKSSITDAVGNLVATNPHVKDRLFTGVKRNDTREAFLIKSNSRGDFAIFWDRWGPRSGILAYEIDGKKLELASIQTNATVNAYSMSMTPDGSRIMMTGGGGWRPPADVSTPGGYYTAIFDAENLETMLGKAPHGVELIFHPVLKFGVANMNGRDLQLFDSRSYAEGEKIHVADGADMRPLLMTFAAKGTKVVLWNGDNPKSPREGLHFVTLDLSDRDLELLAKTVGPLPEPKDIADSAVANDKTRPTPTRNPSPASTPPSTSEETEEAPLEGGVIAVSGFNSKQGLGLRKSGRIRPYVLGRPNVVGGRGEPGWSGQWPASEHAMYQSKFTAEGDAALHLAGTVNFARGFAKPLTGKVEIEQFVRIPEDGQLSCYVWERNHDSCGPMWRVYEGKVQALEGNERSGKKWLDTGIKAGSDEWIKVVVRIDTEARRWKLSLPDKQYTSTELGYRGAPRELKEINYLSETPAGAMIDGLVVREAK